jgi:hypothetical protein
VFSGEQGAHVSSHLAAAPNSATSAARGPQSYALLSTVAQIYTLIIFR